MEQDSQANSSATQEVVYGCAYCRDDFTLFRLAVDHCRERHPAQILRIVRIQRGK